MKLIRTAKIKLDISVADIMPTFEAYTKAFNFVSKTGFDSKERNSIRLHHLTYYPTREYLPSQLAISARVKASEALKSVFAKKNNKYPKAPSCPQSKFCSIRYDKNSYTLFLAKREVSLLTVSGRQRFKLVVPEYYEHYFSKWTACSADLCISKNKVYLHVVFEKDQTDIEPNKVLVGIDRGINNIAVTSNNLFFGGGIVKDKVNKLGSLRRKLQLKGTKSAKRHLKKISKREKRFRAAVNHEISKQIVESLNPGDTIVLEDLTGIRNKRLKKEQRTLINGWSYYQLAQFITYKAAAKGIKVEYIDPRYTSQRCSKCGFICRSNRKMHSFACKACGFKLNSDLNASRNICIKALESYKLSNGAPVNEPIAPNYSQE